MRRRIWCETILVEGPRSSLRERPALAELASPAVVALLRRHAIEPIVAVWPGTLAEARPALATLAGEGLRAAVWPMLADADGRWLGAENAGAFAAFVDRVADAVNPPEIVLDLEPPIADMRATVADRALHAHLLPTGPGPRALATARDALATLTARLAARGIVVSAAVPAPIVLDPEPPARGAWQERLGTPVDGVAWSHVSAMIYPSILEGWSRGLLARADARALGGAFAAATAARFGPRAGVSLGAVGVGAFGDEPTYRSPAELADDVAIARAAGVDDLALFDLGGVLRRPPADAWLEAFTATPPAARVPGLTPRARAALAGMRLAGRAFAAIFGVRARLA